MFGNPSKGYVVSADEGTSIKKKKMVAKCLKFRTKAQVKEKKEENYKQRKKKKTAHPKPVDLWDPQLKSSI